MIADVRPCSPEELQSQIAYLEATPVREIAELLRVGRCSLKKGIVRSLPELGLLKTEFGPIGPLVPSASDGEVKFRVHEVAPILRANPGVDDGGLLAKIEALIEADARGQIQYNVTIFHHGGELIVKDGNKRAIAFYERRKGSGNRIEFPVFIAGFAQYGV